MKKFYSILLAAAVAVSATTATAAEYKANVKADAASSVLATNKAKNAVSVKTVYDNLQPASALTKAPAKAALTSIDEICKVYNYSLQVLGQNAGERSGVLSIEKGEGANDVIIKGLYYIDVNLKGTVDLAKGTISLPVQEILSMPEDPEEPGVDQSMWLYSGMDSETSWSSDPVVLNVNADGTITTTGMIVYGVKGAPGYLYVYFKNLKLTASDYNTTVVFEEYDTDDEGYFQDTTTEYTSYCKATYEENYVVGSGENADELGNTVVLEDFMTGFFSGVSNKLPLPVIIDRDYGCTYLDPWFFFDITLGTNKYRVAPMYAGNDENVEAIEGTFSENVIQWSDKWVLYAVDSTTGKGAGPLAMYKSCKLILPFNVENPGAGINDVIADSDANAPVEFFNLQGARISNPAAGQLVIRRQGKTVTKVFVK